MSNSLELLSGPIAEVQNVEKILGSNSKEGKRILDEWFTIDII